MHPVLPSLLLIWSCSGASDTGPQGRQNADDKDLDGYTLDVDCDDNDPDRSPGKAERCNGIDDDCDTLVDDEDPGLLDPATWYADTDGDGWGDEEAPIATCEVPDGYVAQSGDCDDSDGARAPDHAEDCRALLDLDCDGWVGCADPDCYETCREDCGNEIDDDQDGYVDCEDRDCLDECDTGD